MCIYIYTYISLSLSLYLSISLYIYIYRYILKGSATEGPIRKCGLTLFSKYRQQTSKARVCNNEAPESPNEMLLKLTLYHGS